MNNKAVKYLIIVLAFGFAFNACQKLERPVLKELILDPDPPPYNSEKSFFAFENTTDDAGENKLTSTNSNTSYVAGITGQALQIGAGGYLAFDLKDLVTYPNGYIGRPIDTLSKLGSFTLSFWMNGAGASAGGPITDGAQGVFAISNKDQFWGNLEIFLENYSDPTDANAVWMKIHMFNSAISGGGEQWTADDNTKLKNVLNKWTHIALTYDAATSSLSLYKDGMPTGINNKVLSSNYGKISFSGVTGMVLGSFAFQTNPPFTNHGPEPWARSFNGALDQFRIYNVALSAAEINNLFTSKM